MGWGGVQIGYVRPVQFLDHLTVIKIKTKFSCDTLYVTFARVSEGGGYTLRLHAEDGGTLPREATLTY